MCLERSHSSQSRWPAEKRSQTYRRCDEAGWLSSEKGSGGEEKQKKRLEEFAKDGFPPQMKKFNNMSRWASKCPFSRRGCLTPGVVRNAAKTSPSPRCAPCAPHCQRSDGRRDVKAERGKRWERRRNMKRACPAKTQTRVRSVKTFMRSHWSAAATSTKWTDVLPEKYDVEQEAGHI